MLILLTRNHRYFSNCGLFSATKTLKGSLDNPDYPMKDSKAKMQKSSKMPSAVCITYTLLRLCAPDTIAGAASAQDKNKVTPGEFVIDHPTLINLGFEWLIEGDDNRNAKVEVSYRKQGETQWKQGLPLLRLQGERIYQNQGVFDVVSPNMFAGSILDLEPDTAYEARFVMSDPDGFAGQRGKTADEDRDGAHASGAEARTPAGGSSTSIPPDYKGTKIEPAFDALMCAYNYYCGGGDTVTAGRPRVKAGRHDPGARRALQISSRVLQRGDRSRSMRPRRSKAPTI